MMEDRRTIRETLFYDSGDLKKTLPVMIEWLECLLEKVPAELRSDAIFEVEHEYGYYDSSATTEIRIFYERKETDAEVAERRAQDARTAAAARAANEANERRIYEQLKRKFG